jgi:uncharacterized protein (DUF2235 family)
VIFYKGEFMPKNIAFFADGTWDEPASNSNVVQMYTAAANIPGVQLTFYDSGVGTNGNQLTDILGGAFGDGLFQKIKQGYSDIAAQYLPGDQIFIFGFSRGAYTARSLAGMIAISGLPTVNQNDPPCLDMAFEAYRNVAQRQMLLDTLNETYKMDNAKIQLLGVWDTVGSLGIPAIFGGIDVIQYGFLDTGLHPDVLNAVQAISIDEKRLQFQPALWTSAPVPGQSLTQVWFTGVHCDVGGGYAPDPGGFALSNITLYWMATYAQKYGLQFKPGAFPAQPQPADALATLHNSLTGLYRLTPHTRNIDAASSLLVSVQQRCQTPAANYTPENLHIQSGQLAGIYTIVSS